MSLVSKLPVLLAALATVPATAAPVAIAGYSLSVFAAAPGGSSAPDSIATVGDNVYVGYGNGGDPAGAGGATSTIAEFSRTGALIGTVAVAGHNDGLRYNPATHTLWALQNEDANPTLVQITPVTLAATAPVAFSSTPHGGGYDDVAFGQGSAFVSASNPGSSPNTGPAIVRVDAAGNVLGSVLAGNATATILNPGGGTTNLNLQDPDSLIFAPNGALVLDSQSDQQLVVIGNPGRTSQTVGVLNLPTTVDDTVFAKGGTQRLLFSDRGSNTIYALTGTFAQYTPLAAADSANEIVAINRDGTLNPLVTGLNGPHGEALTGAVPEPATWSMLLAGFVTVGVAARRRRVAVTAC